MSQLEELQTKIKDTVLWEIKNSFICLYYSGYIIYEAGDCDNLVGIQQQYCQTACNNVQDPAFNIHPTVTAKTGHKISDKVGNLFWNYIFPAELPRQADRKTF